MGYNKIPLALGFNDSTGNASGLVEFTLNLSDVGDACASAPATDAVGADALSASAIAATDLPTGTVLQSVTQSSSTVITVTSASMTGFGLSQSFTPKSASSTILILVAVSS